MMTCKGGSTRRRVAAALVAGACAIVACNDSDDHTMVLRSAIPSVPPAEPADTTSGHPPARIDLARLRDLRAFPAATIPVDAHARAYAQWQALKSTPPQSAPGVTPWTSLGPSPLVSDNAGGMGPGKLSGRATAVAVHPSDSNTLYLGTAQGGVWKTADGGVTWSALTDSAPSLSVGAVAIDPAAPSTVYVGTGEANSAFDTYSGQGLLKSTDGGATWSVLGAATLAGLSISKVVVGAAGTLLVSTQGGVDGRNGNYGVYSSADGGVTWTRVFSGGEVNDIEPDPLAPNKVLVAVRNGGTWLLDTNTRSATVIATLPTSSRTEIARSASNPSTLFAQVATPATAIYRSMDNGVSWSQLAGALNACGSQCWYDSAIAVSPVDPNIVFYGGVGCPVWKITGATTASPAFSATACNVVHTDVHALTFSRDGASLWVASDGGIYSSIDGGATWQDRNNGISSVEFYTVCTQPQAPLALWGGTQDNAFAFLPQNTASQTWNQMYAGDGASCVATTLDPTPANRYLLFAVGGLWGIVRSDGSNAFQLVFYPNPDGTGAVVPPLVRDPNSALTVYTGTYRVWRSDQAGASGSFAPASPDLRSRAGENVLSIAVAASNSSRVYAGTDGGALWTSPDRGASWSKIATPPLPGRAVTAIAVDPSSASHVIVSVGGFSANTPSSPGHVFESTNAGASWTRIDSSFTIDIPFDGVVYVPGQRPALFAATDLGVLGSTNGGASWSLVGANLPTLVVYALTYHAATDTLVAATHGRGMWSLPNPRSQGGLGCGATADCLSGFCVDGVCCDSACGGGAPTDCMACSRAAGAPTDGTCAPVTAAASVTCRAATGTCDQAAKCDGTSTACPANPLLPPSTVCAPSSAPCAQAAHCTGSSASCPPSPPSAAGTPCRPAAGVCDLPSTCDGVALACPANGFKPAGTACRPGQQPCEADAACDGASAACPPNLPQPKGTLCTASRATCVVLPVTCNGTDKSCVATTAADGTACDSGDPCLVDGRCTSGACLGTPMVCPTPPECKTSAGCQSGACVVLSAADGTPCRDGGSCHGGQCVVVTHPPDSGAVDASPGAPDADASATADGGRQAGQDGGCKCSFVHESRSPLAPILAGIGLLASRWRRRRRPQPTSHAPGSISGWR